MQAANSVIPFTYSLYPLLQSAKRGGPTKVDLLDSVLVQAAATHAGFVVCDSFYTSREAIEWLIAHGFLFLLTLHPQFWRAEINKLVSRLVDEGDAEAMSKDIPLLDDDAAADSDFDDDVDDDGVITRAQAAERREKAKKTETKKTSSPAKEADSIELAQGKYRRTTMTQGDASEPVRDRFLVSANWYLHRKNKKAAVRVVGTNAFVFAKSTGSAPDVAVPNTTYTSLYGLGPDALNRYGKFIEVKGSRGPGYEFAISDWAFQTLMLNTWSLAQHRDPAYRVTLDDGSGAHASTAKADWRDADGDEDGALDDDDDSSDDDMDKEEQLEHEARTKFGRCTMDVVCGILEIADTLSTEHIKPSLSGNGCGCDTCISVKRGTSLDNVLHRMDEEARAEAAKAERAADKAAAEVEKEKRKADREAKAKMVKELKETAAKARAERKSLKEAMRSPCTVCKTSTLNSTLLGCDGKRCKQWLCSSCHGLRGGAIKSARERTWLCPACEKKKKD